MCNKSISCLRELVFSFMWYIKRALATAFFQNYNQSRYFVKFALWCNTGLLIFWMILLFAVCNKKQFCLYHSFRTRLYLTVAINSIRDLFLQFKDFIRIKLFCIFNSPGRMVFWRAFPCQEWFDELGRGWKEEKGIVNVRKSI